MEQKDDTTQRAIPPKGEIAFVNELLKDFGNNPDFPAPDELRTVYPEVPARVEYGLTESAKALSPVWHAMEKWGEAHCEKFAS